MRLRARRRQLVVGALLGTVDVRGRVVCRRVAGGCVAPFGAGAGQRVASVVNGESLAGVWRVRVVGDDVSAALAQVDGRELPLSGVAADARGHGACSDGWRLSIIRVGQHASQQVNAEKH